MTSRLGRDVFGELTSSLRGVVLAAAAGILVAPLTVASGTGAAVLGAFAAALAADATHRRHAGTRELRAASVCLLALATALAGTWLTRALVDVPAVARLVGPGSAFALSESLRWLFGVTPAVFALRFTAGRRPLLAVAEALIVASGFVLALAAHRNGMVHRPLAFGDWAWSHGLDPAVVFLGLGGVCTFLLGALLIAEERRSRMPLHFAAFALIGIVLILFVRSSGLPLPRPPGDLGLTGEAKAEEGSKGEGDRSRPQTQSDLDFRNWYRDDGAEAPVAVALLHDDYAAPSGVYYFRQSAYSQYNGRRLVQATRDDVDRDVVRRFPAERLQVAEVPPDSDARKPLRTTIGLLVDHVQPFALDSPAWFEPTRNPNPLRFQRTFQALSRVQSRPYDDLLGQLPGRPGWSAEQWQHYTETPSDPRYGEVAREITSVLREEYRGDPLAQALAIKVFFDKNGIYSLRSKHADAEDPTASFLFGDLTGYCVHFAHAAVYLMRELGLPARVAAGYAVPVQDRGDGSSVMIRGANAHAWPEVYLDGAGWVAVDPAPERSLDPARRRPTAHCSGCSARCCATSSPTKGARWTRSPSHSRPETWRAPSQRCLRSSPCWPEP